MESPQGGSFIPKRNTEKTAPTRSGRRIYILAYIAYVFFFGTLLSVVGIFVLNQQAINQLDAVNEKVNAVHQSIDTTGLPAIRKLSRQLDLATQILNEHAAPSIIFDALESEITVDIQLTSFDYEREDSSTVTLTLSGLTDTFDALLFQRNVLASDTGLFASADIIDVNYGTEGAVIQGADRSGNSVSNVSLEEEQTIRFVIKDDAILRNIGYTPRQNTANRAFGESISSIENARANEKAETDSGNVSE